MPSSPKTAPRSYQRMWLVVALITSALVALLALSGTDPTPSTTGDSALSSKTNRVEAFSQHSNFGELPSGMSVRVWRVPADFTSYLTDETGPHDENYFDGWTGARRSYRSDEVAQALCDNGVDFPPGSHALLSLTSGKLEVRNTPDNLALVDQIITDIGPMKMFAVDPGLFHALVAPSKPAPRNRRNIRATTEKLRNTIIPEVDFDGTTVSEAVLWLEQRTREIRLSGQDPSDAVIRFHILDPPGTIDAEDPSDLAGPDPGTATIRELRLRNVPVLTVLQYMCDSSALRFKIDENTVTFLTMASSRGIFRTTREWHVDPILMERFRYSPRPPRDPAADPTTRDPFAPAIQPRLSDEEWTEWRRQCPLRHLLSHDEGISFSSEDSVEYSRSEAILTMTSYNDQLDKIAELFTQLAIEESKAHAGL